MKRILYILAIALSIVACTEEIDKSNRYTFTGETVADFMLNRSDKYSHFINLLERAGLLSLLNTYGQYTLFLPDNNAVEKFIAEKDSIYWAAKDTENPVWTGITSPLVEDLTDSMANVIARTHLIEKNYHTAEFGEGAIAKWNFNDRSLVVSYKVTDERFYIMLNNGSAIIDGDYDVENGVVHLIDKPINSVKTTIAEQIATHDFFGLFHSAMLATGFADRVADDTDFSYKKPEGELGVLAPNKKYIRFTAFVEPDEVFNKYGIYTLDDLKTFAEKWYGSEEKGNNRNPKNALYKFVAYHFVEGELPYNRIVYSRSGSNEDIYDKIFIPRYDLYNYYPTLLGKLMKVLKPLSTTDGKNIYINYNKRDLPYNFEMRNHLDVRIIELTEFTQMDKKYADFVPTAANGIIHPIDKILIYNEDEMVGNILNERIRLDVASLQPELSSNNIWQNERKNIPDGYCKGIKKYGTEDFIHYDHHYAWMGDNIQFYNMYDWAFKLPSLPSRTYEIRMSMYISSKATNLEKEYYQIYFDDKVCCLPIDKNTYAFDESVGWKADSETFDNGIELDKHMHNRGWMKAPESYKSYYRGVFLPIRHNPAEVRKIITTKHIIEGEHWIRFRLLTTPFTGGDFNTTITGFLDYIEFVPLHIINDPTKPEDRH